MADTKYCLKFFFLFFSFLISHFLYAQAATKSSQPPHKGKIVVDEASVYAAPSFDSEVVNTIPKDTEVLMSRRKFDGIFHRVLLPNKTTGFVSDDQIVSLEKKSEKEIVKKADEPVEEKKEKPKDKTELRKKNAKKAVAKKSEDQERFESAKSKVFKFTDTRWFGLTFSQIQFREDTMGEKLSENLQFIGFKIVGPDVLIEGPAPTEINFQIYTQAPGYYSRKTGRDASGLIFITDFMSKQNTALSKSLLFDYGFGLLIRYSRFNVALLDETTVRTYRLEDIVLGLKFALGLGFRLTDQFAIKADAFYNWEKQSYIGYGLTLQKSF